MGDIKTDIRKFLKLDNIKGHFCTITKHRHEVIKNCFRAGIGFQGLFHDLSKYSPTEFFQGIKYYQGTRSPNEQERELFGYSKAWLHHKGRNKHHYEYWNDYNPKTKRLEAVKMPDRYFVEMVCDRIAASRIYAGENYTTQSALNYLNRGRDHMFIHEDTLKELEYVLTILAIKGDEETFKYLRKKVWNSFWKRKN